jgi:hypothetical protein
MIHWWLPSIVPECPATIKDKFTSEPAEVTCPVCEKYVKMRQGS